MHQWMKKRNWLLAAALLAIMAEVQGAQKAKNVILFLADAGGLPTVNAASILGYGEPQKLFVQSWKHIGLSDTSAASQWVTDSAAGMTAIVTGQKTHNGLISQGPDALRGEKDGTSLKTILEHAEERGLSTGVISNVNIADATPAACYSHANDRLKFGEIFLQVFEPRFGDGVDVVLGIGRKPIYDGVQKLGRDLDEVSRSKNRTIYDSLAVVPEAEPRPIVVLDRDLDVPAAARMALRTLSKNRKGYFLMIEWDTHTDNPARGLSNLVGLDKLIREIAGAVDLKETLLLFTADHSFELRTKGGRRGEPILMGFDEWQKSHQPNETVDIPALRVGHSHTGEEVIVAGHGPGAERVQGFLPNTQIFQIMMAAYGWKERR
jgi:alkaline phosphatase